jgi:hypothetical protein
VRAFKIRLVEEFYRMAEELRGPSRPEPKPTKGETRPMWLSCADSNLNAPERQSIHGGNERATRPRATGRRHSIRARAAGWLVVLVGAGLMAGTKKPGLDPVLFFWIPRGFRIRIFAYR